MPALPYEFFAPEQLTINGVEMLGPAWMLLDLADLWVPLNVVANREIPGSGGRLPLVPVGDQIEVSLPLRLIGDVDWNGDPHPDPIVGFRRNWVYLVENVFSPPDSGVAWDAIYQSPDPAESPVEFLVQVQAPTVSERFPTLWEGAVTLVLPGGAI